MPHAARLLIRGVLFFICCILSACSPAEQKPGKPVNQPKLGKDSFLTADGVTLPVRSWLPQNSPPTAVVVALHGFNDYSNSFLLPGEFLSRRGVACYAYDQRGFGAGPAHGSWAGGAVYSDDLTAFAREVRRKHPGLPLYILGESMGGAVTIAAVTGTNRPPVDGVILVAPAVWGRLTMPWYQRWLLAATAHTVPWLKLSGRGLKITPSDNTEMRRALRLDPLVIKSTRIDSVYGLTNLMDVALQRAADVHVPALILYGKHDEIIPREPTLQMLAHMPATARRAFYENGYHMLLRDLQREKPLTDIAVWLSDHRAPLPYGAVDWQ